MTKEINLESKVATTKSMKPTTSLRVLCQNAVLETSYLSQK